MHRSTAAYHLVVKWTHQALQSIHRRTPSPPRGSDWLGLFASLMASQPQQEVGYLHLNIVSATELRQVKRSWVAMYQAARLQNAVAFSEGATCTDTDDPMHFSALEDGGTDGAVSQLASQLSCTGALPGVEQLLLLWGVQMMAASLHEGNIGSSDCTMDITSICRILASCLEHEVLPLLAFFTAPSAGREGCSDVAQHVMGISPSTAWFLLHEVIYSTAATLITSPLEGVNATTLLNEFVISLNFVYDQWRNTHTRVSSASIPTTQEEVLSKHQESLRTWGSSPAPEVAATTSHFLHVIRPFNPTRSETLSLLPFLPPEEENKMTVRILNEQLSRIAEAESERTAAT